MSRYINTDTLEEIKEIADDAFEWGVYVVKMSAIREVPTADVVERKKGEWTYLYDGNYKCSECGSWWAYTDSQIEEMNYCPNCGSDMRERREDEIHKSK